ncbi:radical SAM protein [Candidatus Gracilibacteria bacterium]|nr:radical SAM protein [Candidatus Gracilibacteria bacterium]
MTNHFYIHIPFCNQKCPYCKFALTPIFDEFKKRRYLEYLKKEIREYFLSVPIFACEFGGSISEDFREKFQTVGATASFGNLENQTGNRFQNETEKIETFGTFSHKSTGNNNGKISEDPEMNSGGQKQTIYFGGGTPSILSHDEIREILKCFPFYKNNNTEITLESNPEDINESYINGLISLGINRLSMGIQTLNNKSLTEIHRSDRDSIFGALEGIQNASKNTQNISINVDFILGLPYTKSGEILNYIKQIHRDFPMITHTSVYMLEDEDYPKNWEKNSITELELQGEFNEIIEYFRSIGWTHYELSNFAKPGYESLHNRAYWNHSNSRGFGLSASSYEDRVRWSNASSFHGYYLGKKEQEETLDQEAIETEKMMFGLRTSGWKYIGDFTENTKIQKLITSHLIEVDENIIKPTKTGIFLLDYIMSELL